MLATLAEVEDTAAFGGKATQLGHALRAGLPVPGGFALAHGLVEQIVSGAAQARERLTAAFAELGGAVAVRSSAIGEDSLATSFAGQHATVLNVRSESGLYDAVSQVYASARSAGAQAYRSKLGLMAAAQMAIVVQRLVHAECSGILFTRHPITGADERVIEAAWGLGEAVVSGIVTPDNYRVARGGKVLARTPGEKDIAIMWAEHGGVAEHEVEPERAASLCLTDTMLTRLEELATRCEAVFGGSQDLEWSFAGGELFLLQRRAITRG